MRSEAARAPTKPGLQRGKREARDEGLSHGVSYLSHLYDLFKPSTIWARRRNSLRISFINAMVSWRSATFRFSASKRLSAPPRSAVQIAHPGFPRSPDR